MEDAKEETQLDIADDADVKADLDIIREHYDY